MSFTLAEIAPLLQGTYTTETAARAAFRFVFAEVRALGRVAGRRREDAASDAVSKLWTLVVQQRGLDVAPELKKVRRYLRTVLNSKAIDQGRSDAAESRRRERFSAEPASDTSEERDDGLNEVIVGAIETLARTVPLHAIGFWCWWYPSRLDRPLLTRARAVPDRARADTSTGLARDVEPTLGLLARHASELAKTARLAPIKRRFAWIFRSELDAYEPWEADAREATRAVNTLVKWKTRANTYLKTEQKAGRLVREED